MSFREKSAWISFVTILVVFGTYFWNVAGVLHGDVDRHRGWAIQFGLLVAFVVIQIAARVVVALQSPKEARAPKDERERLIEQRATSVAFLVLVIGALFSIGLMHVTRSAWVIAQHVLLAITVAYLVKSGLQIVYYRRGV
jgi:uncharacterized membrane protein